MMQEVHNFMNAVARKEPFALSRFNDGEMRAIKQTHKAVARGQQTVTPELAAALSDALHHIQANYWVGIPCSTCWPAEHKEAKRIVGERQSVTSAVVVTNRNLPLWRKQLPEMLKNRPITWVGSTEHNIGNLPFEVRTHVRVPDREAFDVHPQMYRHAFARGEVVLLSCGPLATVLACEWFMQHPRCTFIDIGSVFDPETLGRELRVHKGTLPPCKECN